MNEEEMKVDFEIISNEEIEDNSDLFNLDDTQDLSEVIVNE